MIRPAAMLSCYDLLLSIAIIEGKKFCSDAFKACNRLSQVYSRSR
jgi:hypothetical protein